MHGICFDYQLQIGLTLKFKDNFSRFYFDVLQEEEDFNINRLPKLFGYGKAFDRNFTKSKKEIRGN
jgi:hypothetical protein